LLAIQWSVPVAVPLAPVDVCHVTFAIPVPPDAVPASVIAADLAVLTAAAGVIIFVDTGETCAGAAASRVTIAD
jgi:hypothetical protein